jgi:rare lipoprotein A
VRRAASAFTLFAITACSTTPYRPLPDAAPSPEPLPRSTRGNPTSYEVLGHRYSLLETSVGYEQRGVASWYGEAFHGKSTSTGETYDMYAMTAAHRTLPIPCYARVTNLVNGLSVIVKINDRGPFVGNRLIDLSYAAAQRLDMVRAGTALVEVVTLGPAESLAAAATATAPAIAATTPAIAAPLPPLPSPSVATPAGTAAPPPLASLPAVATPLTLNLQVGAYTSEANAFRVQQQLIAAGITGVTVIPGAGATGRVNRVRIGPISNVPSYDQLQAQLAQLGFADARLVSDP